MASKRSSHPSPTRTLPIHVGAIGMTRDIIPYGSFDHEVLKEAVAIIRGESPHYQFNTRGVLEKFEKFPWKVEQERFAEKRQSISSSNDIPIKTRSILHAVVAILSNASLRYQKDQPLGTQVKLTVHAHHYERGPALEAFREGYDESVDEVPAHLQKLLRDEFKVTLHEVLAEMNGDLQTLDAGGSVNTGHPYYDVHSGSALLKYLVESADNIRREHKDPEEIWRLHNQYPEAVNFYFAAQEARFLLKNDGSKKRIENVQHFANSRWMDLVGDLEVSVTPALLSQTRTALQYNPLRSMEAGLAG